ncbi:hypothetical protein CLOSCI_00697 [[Clostridium] scindens ATCC 35704]|nr:hypothetical protein CLOSCI_00697 [[Clostridium] scindens ATCC 35704]
MEYNQSIVKITSLNQKNRRIMFNFNNGRRNVLCQEKIQSQ